MPPVPSPVDPPVVLAPVSSRVDAGAFVRPVSRMVSRTSSQNRIAGLAACIFLAQALAVYILLPLWQAPDEPQSAEILEILARGTAEERQTRYSPRIEGEIVQSMDRWDWWRHMAVDRPSPTPRIFDETPVLSAVTNKGFSSEVALYHWIASRFTLVSSDLETRMLIARLVSLLAVVAAVFFMGRFILLVPGLHPAGAMAALGVVMFHPQLLLVASGATPDGLAIFFTSVAIFLAAQRLIRVESRWALPLLGLLLLAGLFTKRTTVVIGYCLAAILAPAFGELVEGRRGVRRPLVAAAVAAIVCIGFAIGLAANEWGRAMGKFVAPLERLTNVWRSVEWRQPEYLTTWAHGLFISFWHNIGWLRYPLADGWYRGFMVVTVLVPLGAMAALGLERQRAAKVLVVFAIGGLLFQLLAVFGFYGLIGVYAQGRYLLPVLSLLALCVGCFIDAMPAPFRMASSLAVAGFMLAASLANIATLAATYH